MAFSLEIIPQKSLPLLLKTLPIKKIVQLIQTCSEFEPFVESHRKDLQLETENSLYVNKYNGQEISYTPGKGALDCHNPSHVRFEIIVLNRNIPCSNTEEANCQDDASQCFRRAQTKLKLSCNTLHLGSDFKFACLLTAIPCKHLNIYDFVDISSYQLIPSTISTIQIIRSPTDPIPIAVLARFEEIWIQNYNVPFFNVSPVDYYIQFFLNHRGQLRKLRLPHKYSPLILPNLVTLHDGKRFMDPCHFTLGLIDTLDGELLMIRQEQNFIAFSIFYTMDDVAKEVLVQLAVDSHALHEGFASHSPYEDRWLKDRKRKRSHFRQPTSVLLERLISAPREDYSGIIKEYAEDRVTRRGVSLKHVVQRRQKRVPEPIDTSVLLESRMRPNRKFSKHDDYYYDR